jgi:hypothetical protein
MHVTVILNFTSIETHYVTKCTWQRHSIANDKNQWNILVTKDLKSIFSEGSMIFIGFLNLNGNIERRYFISRSLNLSILNERLNRRI